jgi:hypothetical protein
MSFLIKPFMMRRRRQGCDDGKETTNGHQNAGKPSIILSRTADEWGLVSYFHPYPSGISDHCRILHGPDGSHRQDAVSFGLYDLGHYSWAFLTQPF